MYKNFKQKLTNANEVVYFRKILLWKNYQSNTEEWEDDDDDYEDDYEDEDIIRTFLQITCHVDPENLTVDI